MNEGMGIIAKKISPGGAWSRHLAHAGHSSPG